MKEYRTLNDGELVMDGDEFWSLDRRWIPAFEVGKKVTSYTHKMYRRPLGDVAEPENEERIARLVGKIDKIVGAYKQLREASDLARAAGCLDVEGKLDMAIWKMFDVLLDEVDQCDWLEWYIYDNDCGEDAMEAGFDDDVHPIRNSRDLAKLIIESEKRDVK